MESNINGMIIANWMEAKKSPSPFHASLEGEKRFFWVSAAAKPLRIPKTPKKCKVLCESPWVDAGAIREIRRKRLARSTYPGAARSKSVRWERSLLAYATPPEAGGGKSLLGYALRKIAAAHTPDPGGGKKKWRLMLEGQVETSVHPGAAISREKAKQIANNR